MKKMYNNPKTEAVELVADNILQQASVNTDPYNGDVPAPARKGNPLQGQIKM